jgi:hypothetical protein
VEEIVILPSTAEFWAQALSELIVSVPPLIVIALPLVYAIAPVASKLSAVVTVNVMF